VDIISHGLWGSIVFGRKNRRSFWLSFAFGILPDLVAFAPFFLLTIFGFTYNEWKIGEPPDPKSIPAYVYQVYNISHSLIVFFAAFLFLLFLFRRPIWEFSAWGLHIIIDIPTHSSGFFPTPFLWPVSDFQFDGYPWSDPAIFLPNVFLLLSLYVWYFKIYPKRRKIDIPFQNP